MMELTDHQIRAIDDYLESSAKGGGHDSHAVALIVRAIPDLGQRMEALAQRRAHHRQKSA